MRVWPRLVADDSVPRNMVLLLPPDWVPLPHESEKAWQTRIGPRACLILDVLPPEEE